MSERKKLLDLIIAAKRDDPETGSFTEWLADYLIENGVTAQKWIPVSERLPEDGFVILAYHNYSGDKRVCLENYGCGAWFDFSIHMWDAYVTHWMPLPEPPKEV